MNWAVYYHLLHVSARNFVSTGRSVSSKTPKLTPHRSETPSLIKVKLNTIYKIRKNSSKAQTHHQPIKGTSPTMGQNISFMLVFSLLFRSFFLTAPQQKRLGRFWHLYVKRRSLAQGSAFRFWEVPTLPKTPYGFIFPPNPPKLDYKQRFPAETKPWITFQPLMRFSLKLV
jgi:hypothetical protein